jgi:carboxypeptidase family protein
MFVKVKALRKATRLRFYVFLACTAIVLSVFPATALAGVGNNLFPDTTHVAPIFVPQSSSHESAAANPSASVGGTVLDLSGASVSGSVVSLIHEDRTEFRMLVSADGEFNFTNVPAGSYFVTVNAKDFVPFKSAEFVVAAQQVYEVPDVSLTVASAITEVTVRPTEFIAGEQIKAAETQRLVGVIPNFYTS